MSSEVLITATAGDCPWCSGDNPYASTCRCPGWCGVDGCSSQPKADPRAEMEEEEEEEEPVFEGFRSID